MLSANIPNETRRKIYARDHYRCALCDSDRYIQVHHYIPRGRGGSNSPHNLVTLCSTCHGQAHGMKIYDMDISVEEIDQLLVEYLADYYAPEWNPYRRE